MASPRACSQCLRLVRRQIHSPKTTQFPDKPTRAFSLHLPRLQQAPQPRDLPSDIPPVPPTTTGTVTSNVTAQPPPTKNIPSDPASCPQDDLGPGPSTAEMQRTITSSLLGPSSSSLPDALASKLRKSATKTTDPYMTYGISQALFNTCSQQANYTIPESQRQGLLTGQGPPKTSSGEDLGIPDPPITPNDSSSSSSSWWFNALSLPPTFSTWSQVSYLHMYILVVRLRVHPDPVTVAKYQHYLLDHFSHAAEDKMVLLHGMSARGIRNRYLKDLFLQWRGVLAAYDEGLVKGDAVLGSAVWRNLFKGGEDVDWERVAQVVGFIRASVKLLATVGEGEILRAVRQEGAEGAQGSRGIFEQARMGLRDRVRRESRGMKEAPSATDAAEPVVAATSP